MTDSNQPLVSAIIPTKDRCEYLKKALNSVFEQSWENIEVIVVDDASEDGTPALLSKMAKEHPVTVLRNRTSKGAAASRNQAIKVARGQYIAGLDDDDLWRPDRIKKLLNDFTEGISAVCSHDRMVFGEREIVWKKKQLITLDDLLYYNQVGNQVLTRKKYLMEVGGYDEELPSAQDYDLWIRLAKSFGPVKTVPSVLQVVHMEESRDRISNSESQLKGYYRCFEKHKSLMSEPHIKYQKYRLRMVEGEPVSWFDMLGSVPPKFYVKEIIRKLFL